MDGLDLTGLDTRPAQTWGAIRLVPLVRREPITDLRLNARLCGDEVSVVAVTPRISYISYVPHAFVATWTGDGTAAAAYGTQLARAGGDRAGDDGITPRCVPLRFRRRMARRTDKDRLRFLPLHLALEGYLALHFGGPDVLWSEWSWRAIRGGLSPRVEQSYVGEAVEGLRDALRVFEIHPGQCGVMIYAADALASAFVVPHPDDYRALHATLLLDMYGELVYHYAMLMPGVGEFRARLDATRIASLADLREQARRQSEQWEHFHDTVMAGGLLDRRYTVERVYELGRFTLSRFLPPFDRQGDNHIGEMISDREGRVAYLKTLRLSEAQVRRGYLLSRLAACGWDLAAAAEDLGVDVGALVARIERAGFAELLRQDVRDHFRARSRKAGRHG